jgi:hypothetical protein
MAAIKKGLTMNSNTDIEKYDLGVTVKKAGYPLLVIALVESAYAALVAAGVHVDKALLYTVAVSGYSAIIAFINWIKNHKKGKLASA